MKTPPVVSLPEWEAARQQLLVKEKDLTRTRDALAAERRRMPWLAVEQAYAFDGPAGTVSLLGLFEGRRQLIVYRAFFEPGVHGWPGARAGHQGDHLGAAAQVPGPAGDPVQRGPCPVIPPAGPGPRQPRVFHRLYCYNCRPPHPLMGEEIAGGRQE